MQENIKKKYAFDFVFDTQQVFREVLQAMANPGTVRSIAEQSGRFSHVYAPLTALGCMLMDQEEVMYVEKNPRLLAELAGLTLAREGKLEDADYIFLSSEMNYETLREILKHAKKGTYEDPQDSGTIVILCQEITGKSSLTLSGPGIDGAVTIMANQYIKTIIGLRQELCTEYPLGTELIFMDPYGEILCIPRLVKAGI